MVRKIFHSKISSFIMGAVCAFALILLLGAANTNPMGKYQMEAVLRNNITHIYVMDTTTGRVKWVDGMNISFDEMKGE